MFVKKLFEILFGDTNVDVVIHLNGNTLTVALTNAEASGQNDLIREPVLGHGILQHFHYIGRTLNMAGTAYTYLYYHPSFAFTLVSKNSSTPSGVTEKNSSSTVTQTPC